MPTATATLTQRQKDMLAAAAVEMAASVHPLGSQPRDAFFKLAHALWESVGEWTAAEFDEALALAQELPEPPVVQ